MDLREHFRQRAIQQKADLKQDLVRFLIGLLFVIAILTAFIGYKIWEF